MQHGNELAILAVEERERNQPAADTRHGYHDRVEDFHDGGHHADVVWVVSLAAADHKVSRQRRRNVRVWKRRENGVLVFVWHDGV